MRWKFTIAFVVGGLVGFATSQLLQSALDAYASSAIKRSTSDAVAISRALERYKQDNGRYPDVTGGWPGLSQPLAPKYLRAVPKDTYSGEPYIVLMTDTVPVVMAPGSRWVHSTKRRGCFPSPVPPAG
jgi:type II secretory pathway pseudopilin PulG